MAKEPSAPALTMSDSERLPKSKSEMGERWCRKLKRGEEPARGSHRAMDRSVEAETII